MRARPGKSGPVTLPRILQGATCTCGLFRMRLYFHESLRVITYSFPSPSPNQTGVRTGVPSFLKVVSEIYFCPAMWGGIAIESTLSRTAWFFDDPIARNRSDVLQAKHA